MDALGKLILNRQEYLLGVNENKTKVVYTLYTRYTEADSIRVLRGERPQDAVITTAEDVKTLATVDHVVESVTRMKKTGKVTFYKNNTILQQVIDHLGMARMYSFKKNEVIEDDEEQLSGDLIHYFNASNSEISFRYKEINGMMTELDLVTGEINLSFLPVSFRTARNDLVYQVVTTDVQKKILVSSIKLVTYQILCESSDMSWFEENGVRKKRYDAITTVKEFEDKIMTPLAREVQRCEAIGEQVHLAIDTETTGLNVYDLSDSNSLKDHCVAIPISWEDDAAYVIFTDMEFFDSIPNDYVMKRLEPFITEPTWDNITSSKRKEIKRSVTLKNTAVEHVKEDDLGSMDVFGFDADDLLVTEQSSANLEEMFEDGEVVEFFRQTVNLIGHNTMFDGRVFFNEGTTIWFDNDTMQMAFNLNPGVGKGSKKLKVLTRKLFGHETPELTDILGKGNEDKYRYLKDKLVAIIYGCADADYTRRLFLTLKPLMTPKMYRNYQRLDMPMENLLYKSEYYGMPVQSEDVRKMAENSERNLNILTEFIYGYVGKFVYIRKEYERLEDAYKAGILTLEEYNKQIEDVIHNVPPNARHEFDMKGTSIAHVLYGILGYPIFAWTKGDANGNNKRPKTDKNVMKKLKSEKWSDKDTNNIMRTWKMTQHLFPCDFSQQQYDELVAKDKEKYARECLLVDKDAFNKCKYPLAIALSKWAELNKEYTSYFKPTLENDLEGRLFKSYSLSRIETRRIANAGQTMKGKLKAMVRSYNDDYYMLDFDMSQVEYRIMASRSSYDKIIEKMRDPEKDYHIETASLVHNIPADKVSKDLRKKTKCVGFGLPYGLSTPSLAENLFGNKSEDAIFETANLVNIWKKNNKPIVKWLEEQRANTLKEATITEQFRNYIDAWEYDVVRDSKNKIISKTPRLDSAGNKIPIPVGKVNDGYGFYRLFYLDNMTNSKMQSIRRQSGNYPIQTFAAELFRTILIRFREACVKYGIEDKVKWHMLIHDELLCSVHKSVHPFLIYKIIDEACMITVVDPETRKKHTNYFVGANIGKTWAETKDDSREAPVYFLRRMVERYEKGEFTETWVDDPWEFIKPLRKQYVTDRIGEVVKEIQSDSDENPIDVDYVYEHFSNYTVKGYVMDYAKALPVDKSIKDEELLDKLKWISSFITWMCDHYGEGKLYRNLDGKVYEARYGSNEEASLVPVDYAELFEDEKYADTYWSFDESGDEGDSAGVAYSMDYEEEDEEEDVIASYFEKTPLNTSVENATSVADFLVPDKTSNVFDSKNQYIIHVDSMRELEALKKLLTNKVSDNGKSVLFRTPINTVRWMKVVDLDINLIDDVLDKMRK